MREKTCGTRGSAVIGFSLLELLIVIGIMGLLAAVAIPAISGTQGAMQLTKAASLVQDHLQLARQLAITRNKPVLLNLCFGEDEMGSSSLNTLVLTCYDKDGRPEIIERPIQFPLGLSVSENPTWSSIINTPVVRVILPSGKEVNGRAIRFEPSGSTSLAASGKWHLTVYSHQKTPSPEANFVTLSIDPVTGRVFAYQP